MATTTYNTIFKLKRGTADRWAELNPILEQGEPGFVYDNNKLKIGDGITPWNELEYIAEGEDLENTYLSFEKQELTNEQKLQIKNNLSLPNVDNFYFTGFYGTDPYFAGYYFNGDDYLNNIETILNTPSPNDDSSNIMKTLLERIYSCLDTDTENKLYNNILPKLIKDYSYLYQNNFFKGNLAEIQFYQATLFSDVYKTESINKCELFYNSNTDQYIIISRNTINAGGMLKFDDNGNILINTMGRTDKTLSKSNRAADAKTTGEALATKLSIEEQELTDEQISQVKSNLYLPDYKWVYIPNNNADYPSSLYVENNTINPQIDWEAALQVLDSDDNLPLIYDLLDRLYTFAHYTVSNINWPIVLPNIINDFQQLKQNNIITGSLLYALVNDNNNFLYNEKDIEEVTMLYSESQDVYRIYAGATNSSRVLVFNGNGEITYNSLDFTDKTLSYNARPADAKATGDTLASKANQTDLESLQTLVGETSVSEQISNNAVLFSEEQELTEDQRAIARDNISQYKYRTFTDQYGTYTYAISDSIHNYDLIQTIPCVTGNGDISALEDIVGYFWMNTPELEWKVTQVKSVISNFKALRDGNVLSEESITAYTFHNDINKTYMGIFSITDDVPSYLNVDATHYIFFENDKGTCYKYIYYNDNTETIVKQYIKFRGVTENLSKSGYAADAKVVGDALAEKADILDNAYLHSKANGIYSSVNEVVSNVVLNDYYAGTKVYTSEEYPQLNATTTVFTFPQINTLEPYNTFCFQIKGYYNNEIYTLAWSARPNKYQWKELMITGKYAATVMGIVRPLHNWDDENSSFIESEDTFTLDFRIQHSSVQEGFALEDLIESIKNAEFSFYVMNKNFLPLNNTNEYTPTADYNPATKKYIDDGLAQKSLVQIITWEVDD